MSISKTDKQYCSKVIQIRLYPNKSQQDYLSKCFGCGRYLYNYFLNKTQEQYKIDKTFLWYTDLITELPKLKKQEETKWLKEVDSTCLQSAVRNLDNALSNFVNSKSGKRKGNKVGFPKFKKKSNKQSARFISNKTTAGTACKVDYELRKIKIPKLKSWIKFANKIEENRIPNGTLQSISIIKTPAGNYYASLLYKIEKQPSNYIPNPENCIGLDFGLKTFITTSNGDKINSPKVFNKSQKHLARLARRHSRKKTNSKNREKSRLRLAKQHEKIANRRKDFNHKLSRKLVNQYDFIFIEDLNIKGMSRDRKRKKSNAKTRKQGLGKQINDLAWSQFVSFLMYKALNEGKFVIKVGRYFPSSQLCSHCGYKNENLTLKDREWICPQCGQVHDRDVNAAINILNEGRKLLFSTVGPTGINACGDRTSSQ